MNTAPPFPESLLAPWCRVWLHLQQHRRHLVDWLGRQPNAVVGAAMEVPWKAMEQALAEVLDKLDAGIGEDATLVRALGCLRNLERHHPTDPRAFLNGYPEVTVTGGRHVLLPPLRRTTRSTDPDANFPLSGDLALDGALGLSHRWVPLQAEDVLDWRAIAELDVLRDAGTLRVGLAPCGSVQDMNWTLDHGNPRGPDGRIPVQCRGACAAATLGADIEAVLAGAWAEKVQLLLLPELVVDDELLQRCRDWLRQHNARERRLRMVIAGSRHCGEGKAYANRCTVLGPLGTTLWEQDKRSPFVIEDRATLDGLSPATPIKKAFEPTALGQALVIAESAIGRLLTPICLDYIEGDLWGELGADLYLVPAMTPGLSRFSDRARQLGSEHGAATLVCNAQTGGKHRCLSYLPFRGAPQEIPHPKLPLFILDAPLNV